MAIPSLVNAALAACVGLAFGGHLLPPMSGAAYLECDRTPFTSQEDEPDVAVVTVDYQAPLHARALGLSRNVVCARATRPGSTPTHPTPGAHLKT
jgi:hypothetical protein